MTRTPVIAALLVALLVTPAQGASISNVRPSDHVLNPSADSDLIGGHDALSWTLSTPVTGEAVIRTEVGEARTEVTTLTVGETGDIEQSISVDQIRQFGNPEPGDLFDVTIEFTAAGTESSTPETHTITDVVLDGTPPDPVDLALGELVLGIGDGAVEVHWNPAAAYSTYATDTTNNVERFRIIWATSPLSDVIDTSSLTRKGERYFATITDYGSASTRDADGTARSLTLDGLSNGDTVWVTIQPIDHAGNGAQISVDASGRALFEQATPISGQTFAEIGGIDDRCFVVTAAWGDPRSPLVDAWRFFRDGFLARIPGGRLLIAWYYDHSPPAAAWLSRHALARDLARVALLAATPLALALGGAGPLALALLITVPLVRSRRRTLPFALLPLLLAAPEPAVAVEWIRPGVSNQQTLSLALRQLQPELSGTALDGSTVRYRDIYGRRGVFPLEAAWEWLPIQLAGDWGIRLAGGFGVDRGNPVNVDASGITRLSTRTRFVYLPTSAALAWRWRWFEDQPVTLHGHAGVDFWGLIENGQGSPAVQNFVFGWHAGGELELALDWMERRASTLMKDNWGIEQTAIFGGWQKTWLDDFGQSTRRDFTHDSWTAGLRFSF